jgi:predicted phosphodiesterase
MTDTLSTSAEGTTNAKSMRWAVLGDIHANLEALQAVLEDARLQQCTAHACVGDVVGYNANPRECLELIRSLDTPCVKGNHDHYAASSEALDNLSPRAAAVLSWSRDQIGDEAKAWLSGLPDVRLVANFSIVHATLDQPSSWGYVFERFAAAASFTYQRTAVCFFGHTHFPMAFLRDPPWSPGASTSSTSGAWENHAMAIRALPTSSTISNNERSNSVAWPSTWTAWTRSCVTPACRRAGGPSPEIFLNSTRRRSRL